jgi:hypothetical protein
MFNIQKFPVSKCRKERDTSQYRPTQSLVVVVVVAAAAVGG